MSAAIIPIQSAYEKLKADVDSSHLALEAAWVSHVQAVKRLQDSNLWKAYNPHWVAYCHDFLPYEANTYTVYAAAIPIALIVENVTKVTPNKQDSRALTKRLTSICQDETLIGQTYERAYRETKKVIPTEGELKAVYTVLKQRKDTNTVTFNGLDFAIEDESIHAAIAEELWALGERKELHIEEGSKVERKAKEIAQIEALQLFFDYSSSRSKEGVKNFRISFEELKP